VSSVVLFNHPGGEHYGEGGYPWNCGPHRRKYLVCQGQEAIRANGGWAISGESRRQVVWAEYEPDTTAKWFQTDPEPGEPWSWHERGPVPAAPRGAANTEPWIFGKAFRYFLCRQESLTYLKELQVGDLILFGSWLKQGAEGQASGRFNFFLDTVFVIDDSIMWSDRDEAGIPKYLLDPAFVHATFNRSGCGPRRRFYWGKMLSEKASKEPFCWAPCEPWLEGEHPPRRRRPLIGDLFGHYANNGQVFRKREDLDPGEAWKLVTRRCLDLGYSLGVHFDNPRVLSNVEGEVGKGCAPKRC
jgi:hypothetical protein